MKTAVKIIKSKKQYNLALQRFSEIFQAKKGTPESDEADFLSLLIKDYEDKHFVIRAQYNEELEEAEKGVKAGKFVTNDKVMKAMKKW